MLPSGPKRLSGPQNMFSDNLTCLEWILDWFWKADFFNSKIDFLRHGCFTSEKNVFWASFQNLTCPSVLNINTNKARRFKNMTISKDLSSGFLIEGLLFEKIDFLWIFRSDPSKIGQISLKNASKNGEKKQKMFFFQITSNAF